MSGFEAVLFLLVLMAGSARAGYVVGRRHGRHDPRHDPVSAR